MERNDSLRVFTENGGYVFVDRKLQNVKWLRTEFTLDHIVGEVMYYNSRTIYQKPDGTTGELHDYDKAYASPENYEQGTVAETEYKRFSKDEKQCGEVIHDITMSVKRRKTVDYWTFDKAHQIPVHHELKMEKFYYDYTDKKFHTDEFPNDCEIYDTKEDALSYNTYKIVENDGTEYEREGVNKLITLDDDQLELVKQFEGLCKKMEDNGILLISDCCEYLSAFNIRNVKDYALDYNDKPYDTVNNPEDYEQADRYGKSFQIKHTIQIWGEDNNFFIIRKSANNKEK